MIAVASSLVAMTLCVVVFLAGALGAPGRSGDRLMVAGILGMIVSALAVGGSVVAVLP